MKPGFIIFVAAIDAMNTWYGRGDIPVGIYKKELADLDSTPVPAGSALSQAAILKMIMTRKEMCLMFMVWILLVHYWALFQFPLLVTT